MATQLRVATFNVRNGRAFDGWNSWPFRRPATTAAIAGLEADVVGLQEVLRFQLSALRTRLPRYGFVGSGRDDGRRGEHSPVLHDTWSLRLLGHTTRWYGDEPHRPGSRVPGAPFPRIATTCRLALLDGTEVHVTSTHLDSKSAERRLAAVEQLLTWLDPEAPQIVLGDLNAGPASAVLARLVAGGLRPALDPDAGGTSHSFTGRTDGRQIDHVLVRGDIEVVDARVEHPRPGGRLPSDHWPVVADLRVGG